jgi:hypothetical protein
MNGNITVQGQMISLIRKQIPAMVAQQIVGVQPMSSNQRRIFMIQNPPKYKFSRARWYVAEFNSDDYYAVDAWCEKQFGPHPRNPDAWSRWWHKFENSILFRDEKDYVLFLLRWS